MTSSAQLPYVFLNELSFSFLGKYAQYSIFKRLNWSFSHAQIHAIVGPSGIGKSTLLRLIHGIEQPQSGNITFPAFAKRPSIASLPQEQMLLPWKTGKGNLTLVKSLLADNQLITEEFNQKLLQTLEIASFLSGFELYPVQMSGGMRQRLALARALLMARDILLLDEPFGGIDFPLKLQIIDRLHNYIRNKHIVCLIVLHDIEDAVALADQIVVLVGNPARIVQCHDISAELLSLSPSKRRRSAAFHEHVEHVLAIMNDKPSVEMSG